MDPYEALREYDAEYRREELELAQIQDEIKAVRAELEKEEKVCVALEAKSLQLDRDIENAELRRAAVAAKMESVRNEEEKIMPELMKQREKLEKQERMRAAMEKAIAKRAEFVDKMVHDYQAKIFGLPRMAQYMQVKHEIEELEQAISTKKKSTEARREALRQRKEKENVVWEEFKKLCIQLAKNWKRASEEAKKKEEEDKKLQQRKKLMAQPAPAAAAPRYPWMSHSVKPSGSATLFSRTKLGSSPFSFYKKPEISSNSLLKNLTQATRKGNTDDSFWTRMDQQAEQFFRTSAAERAALVSGATSRLSARLPKDALGSILSEEPQNRIIRGQEPSPNKAKTSGSSLGSVLAIDRDANSVVNPEEAKPPRRVTYAPMPMFEEYSLPVLEKHTKKQVTRPKSVASLTSHDLDDNTTAQRASGRCQSATFATSAATVGTPKTRYASEMDIDDGKKTNSAAASSKSPERNIPDSSKEISQNFFTFDNRVSTQGDAGASCNYNNGDFFAEIQQDVGLPGFGYSDEKMEQGDEEDHPFGRFSPSAGEFDFAHPFA